MIFSAAEASEFDLARAPQCGPKAHAFPENTMFAVIMGTWVVTGLIVGVIATKFVNLRGDDPKLGLFAGAAAAFVAGLICAMVSGTGVNTWSWWGVMFAAIGAAVAVTAWHVVRSRSISHARYVPRQSY